MLSMYVFSSHGRGVEQSEDEQVVREPVGTEQRVQRHERRDRQPGTDLREEDVAVEDALAPHELPARERVRRRDDHAEPGRERHADDVEAIEHRARTGLGAGPPEADQAAAPPEDELGVPPVAVDEEEVGLEDHPPVRVEVVRRRVREDAARVEQPGPLRERRGRDPEQREQQHEHHREPERRHQDALRHVPRASLPGADVVDRPPDQHGESLRRGRKRGQLRPDERRDRGDQRGGGVEGGHSSPTPSARPP